MSERYHTVIRLPVKNAKVVICLNKDKKVIWFQAEDSTIPKKRKLDERKTNSFQV